MKLRTAPVRGITDLDQLCSDIFEGVPQEVSIGMVMTSSYFESSYARGEIL